LRRKICSILFLLLLITSPFCLAETLASPNNDTNAAVQLTQFRWANRTDAVTGASSLRFVFDVSGPVQVDGAVIDTPTPRLVVILSGAVPGKLGDPINLDSKIASRVSVSSEDGQNSRITIELPLKVNDGDYKIFTLPGDVNANKPFRVVVDIKKPVTPVTANYTSGLRGKKIVIDPGHGGSDSGAIGPNNVQEKTVTLAVALQVKDLLEKAGAKVIMTRTDDRDVYAPNDSAVDELGARAAVGNTNKADVFVDIHANSFSNPKVGGTGTYYYEKSSYDKLLAQSIQDSVVSVDGLVDRGIYPANFYVLKHTLMPAMLIELGFISNPDEETLLNTPQFQQKLAQGIVQGLDNFFVQAATVGGRS
jgi:N-acetylmuramoyl-L-alanine amidase